MGKVLTYAEYLSAGRDKEVVANAIEFERLITELARVSGDNFAAKIGEIPEMRVTFLALTTCFSASMLMLLTDPDKATMLIPGVAIDAADIFSAAIQYAYYLGESNGSFSLDSFDDAIDGLEFDG